MLNDCVFFFQLGNPTATVIALCALRDVSIEQESSQLAILELGGIGILLNILKTDHWPCVVRFFYSGSRLTVTWFLWATFFVPETRPYIFV